jgi:large subunit ribosomal protein L25
MAQIILKAEPRGEFGSHAARRIREQGLLPANIYGRNEEHLHVTLDLKEFTRFLEAGHRIATVQCGKKSERSVVKEVQYDALGSTLIHVDFSRISSDEKIQMSVPVETIGVPKGVASGGVLVFPLKELAISGLPDDIPEHYEVRIEALELGQAIRLKDLPPPANCTLVGDPELVVILVAHPKEEAPAPLPEAQPAQPEVIGKKKEEVAEAPEAEGKKKEKEKETGKDKDKEKEK